MENQSDAWRVQLKTGELRLMSLDALDDAFNAGIVDAQTPVLAPGSVTWDRLGAVAGLDDVSPASQMEIATPSLSPVALSPSIPPSMPPAVLRDLQFDLDLPDDALKPKRGRVLAFVGVAMLLVVAGGAGLVAKLGGHAEAPLMDIKPTAAAQAPAPAVETPPVATASKPQLSDEQKKKLADADKAREAQAKAAKEKAAAQQQRRAGAPRTKGTGLLKGGNKFDPLNGSL
jgi:hypothetical protein